VNPNPSTPDTPEGQAMSEPEMFGEAWMAEVESADAPPVPWVESADEAYATLQAENDFAADLPERED